MDRIDHRHRMAAWLAAGWLAAIGCSTDTGDTGGGAGADPAAPTANPTAGADPETADDAAGPAHRLGFAPCAEDPELECGRLSVPLDYANPHGEQITLATVRAPALTRHKIGSLFVNPGGPGGSGVDLVILGKALLAPLRQRFDIVSFDPRGTARSQVVNCAFDIPALPADGSLAAQATFLDEVSARYARACREQHGALAEQIGTNNVARDMDRFRAALGERELNYLGFSYGTMLGASYATLFPGRVRAMVLDGNVTPAWFSDYLLELDADGSAGAELALRRLDQRCADAADCPLRAAGVVAVFDRVVERLTRSPVPVAGGVITGQSVVGVVFPLLYQELRGWPLIVRILAAADAGDYTGLPAVPTDTGPTAVVPSTFAIVCDDSASRRPGLDYLPAQIGNQPIYPRFGGTNFGLAITLCSAWPRTAVRPLDNLATHHPVLLIGNDFDPATPMAWSRNMATALGDKAALVRYQGGGHTVYGSGSACIDGAVASYLEGLTVPRGLVCPAQPLAFGASQQRAATVTMADILRQVAPPPPVLPRR